MRIDFLYGMRSTRPQIQIRLVHLDPPRAPSLRGLLRRIFAYYWEPWRNLFARIQWGK
jgi:hypothetical protein